MTTYNIAIMVRNEYGVLNRVTSMFRRRQFNILSLTVSETETERLSRITVQYEGEERSKRQLVAQLAKLPDVISWKEFDPEDSISCELLLIKMANRNETRRTRSGRRSWTTPATPSSSGLPGEAGASTTSST